MGERDGGQDIILNLSCIQIYFFFRQINNNGCVLNKTVAMRKDERVGRRNA